MSTRRPRSKPSRISAALPPTRCEVVESLDSDRVIFLPDEFLGRYVAGQTKKEVILWKGHCEVHEKFTAKDLRTYRESFAGIVILAHPECPPDVLAEADYVGSTAGMIQEVGKRRPQRVLMVTECSMSDNVAVEFPQIEFVRPCNLCPHMKLITLPKILDSLQSMKHVVEVDPLVAERARQAVQRMLELRPPADMPNNSNPSTDLVPLYPILYEDAVRRALAEDLGRGDATTDAIVSPEDTATARIIARGAGPHRRHRYSRLCVLLSRSATEIMRSSYTTGKMSQQEILWPLSREPRVPFFPPSGLL